MMIGSDPKGCPVQPSPENPIQGLMIDSRLEGNHKFRVGNNTSNCQMSLSAQQQPRSSFVFKYQGIHYQLLYIVGKLFYPTLYVKSF